MNQSMSLKDVSRLLNVKPYRVEYALANGLVAEPAERVAGRRLFTPDIVEKLAAHFGCAVTAKEPVAEAAGV